MLGLFLGIQVPDQTVTDGGCERRHPQSATKSNTITAIDCPIFDSNGDGIGTAATAPTWLVQLSKAKSLAVGRREFAEQVQAELGDRARYRDVQSFNDSDHVLRESREAYGRDFDDEIDALTYFPHIARVISLEFL